MEMARLAVEEGLGPNFAVRLDTAKLWNNRLAWIGVVSPEGRVILGSDRILLGADVSARPWFRAGLQGTFAGDVREARRLTQHLAVPSNGEAVRLIDFSSPLRRADGTPLGVLASNVNWHWVRDLIRTAPMPEDTQALLMARDGMVLAGPPGMEGRRLSIRAALSARQGVAAASTETWEDGVNYFTVAMPVPVAEGAPGFGWSVVVRQNPTSMVGIAHDLGVKLGLPLVLASALVLVAGLLVAFAVAQPLRRLAIAATALAEGRLEQPVGESRTSWEMAAISDALARLDHQAPTNVVKLRAVA
jgi:HAMP domain-containing protein